MRIDKQKIKQHLNDAKNIFTVNGWIPVVYGLLLSMLATPVVSGIGSAITSALASVLRFIPYEFRYTVAGIPKTILVAIIASMSTIFVIGGLIYVIKNGKKIDIPDFIKVGLSLCQKYYMQILILLVVPKVIIDGIGNSAISLAIDFISDNLLYSLSFKFMWVSAIVGTIIATVFNAVYSGLSIWAELFFISKFVSEMDEVNISSSNREFIFSTVRFIGIGFIVLSLIPVIGTVIASIVTFGFTFFFYPFLLTLDDGLRNSATTAYSNFNTQRAARPVNNGDIFAPSQNNNNSFGGQMNPQQSNYNNNGFNPNQQNQFNGYQGQPNNPFNNQQYNSQQNNQFNNQYNNNNQFNQQNNYQNQQNNNYNQFGYNVNQNQQPVAMNKFCSNCGQPVSNETRFCSRCGSPVQ